MDEKGYVNNPKAINDLNDKHVMIKRWENIYPYDIYSKNGKILTTGYSLDFGVVNGYGNSLDNAIEMVYDEIQMINLRDMYYRSIEDFLSESYSSAIMSRFSFLEKKLKILD